jgi:hypothetical protein
MAANVLSALARPDVDPWRGPPNFARMPKQAATGRIAPFIAALSDGLGATGLGTGRRFTRVKAAPA